MTVKTSKYKINKGHIFQKVGSDIVIFDTERSILFTLNHTAATILEKIKQKYEDKEIIAFLVKKYDISEKIASRDCRLFISKLVKEKIVTVSSKESKTTAKK